MGATVVRLQESSRQASKCTMLKLRDGSSAKDLCMLPVCNDVQLVGADLARAHCRWQLSLAP